jgi:hypothetical protein
MKSALPKPPRQPLDPITNLWRKTSARRRQLLEPFLDKHVKVERWFGRTPDSGDQLYRGTVVAVALSTTGTTADFLILKTVEGNVWAISVAQIAYLELIPKVAK